MRGRLQRIIVSPYPNRSDIMIQRRRPELYYSNFFEKLSIAWEFARARKWARAHPKTVLDQKRPTVGEALKDKDDLSTEPRFA
jgi:hypothetical protein